MRPEWTAEEFQEANKKAAALTLHALTTDGAHHKQWYLEQIATVLGINLQHFVEQTGYAYEKGIAP